MRRQFTMVSMVALAIAMVQLSAASAQEVRGPESPQQTSNAPSPASTASITTSAPGSVPDSGGLVDIIVTARKIAENQQKVPVAITAFTGAQLQQQGAVTVQDIATLTPGLYIEPNPSAVSAPIYSIRGQVQAEILATVDPSVGTYVDGLYWARAYGVNADLLDIQSVQTLKGPQGTLFGRNTTGGAVLLQTNDPNFRGLSALASATYGRFNEIGGTAIINIPIVEDKIALRLAGEIRNRDGYVHNTFDGRDYGNIDRRTLRAKLLVKPTETLSFLFSAEYYKADERPQPYHLGFIAPTTFTVIGGRPIPTNGLATLSYGISNGIFDPFAAKTQLNALIAATRDSDTYATNSKTQSYAETQTYTGTATLNTFFGAIKFIGGYRDVKASAPLDIDGTAVTVLSTGPIDGRANQQDLFQYSGELQFTGKAFADTVDFAFGALYFKEKGNDGSQSFALAGINPNNPNVNDGRINNDSMGVYGQATGHITNRLSLTGGLRYSIDDKGLTTHNRVFVAALNGFVCTLTGAAPAPGCSISRKDSFDGVSYTAGLDYRFSNDILGYVKTARGFRSGGQNLRASGLSSIAFQPFRPETATNYEVGLKSEFLDRRVRLNLAGYYTETTNLQRTINVAAPSGAAVVSVVGNAGKQRVIGGEAEATAILFRGFTLAGTAAIVEPKYLDYFDGIRDRRGDRFAYTPKFTGTVSGTYERKFGDVGGLLRLDYIYQSSVAYDAYNNPGDPYNSQIEAALTDGAHSMLNGRAAVTLNDGRYELSVFGRNLLDRRGLGNAVYIPTPLSYVVTSRDEPRTFGVTGTVKFGAH